MALPSVHGWMIDFRTAHGIFTSKNNRRISHCIAKCKSGIFHICHHEETNFKNEAILAAPFLVDQCCVVEPDDDIYNRCPGIRNSVHSKTILGRGDVAVFITATALSRSFGVISDAHSPVFTTVIDLCAAYGVPALSADQYFSLV